MAPNNFPSHRLQPLPEVSPFYSGGQPAKLQSDPRMPYYGYPLELIELFSRHPEVVDAIVAALRSDAAEGHHSILEPPERPSPLES